MPKNGDVPLSVPLAILGGLGLGYAGARALLGLAPGADDDFFKWKGSSEKGLTFGSAQFDVPAKFYRADTLMGAFGAQLDQVRALLPSPQLYPATLPGGRAVLFIIALNYHETDVGPYGEIIVAVPCTYGRKSPSILPLVLEARYPTFGAFVVHMPVTSRVARDAGRGAWGFAKFVGDMGFEKQPSHQRVRLSEEGRHIFTLTVRQQGLLLKDNRPLVAYTVRDGQLMKTTIPSRGVYQMELFPGYDALELGDHPIAEQLRQLDIDLRPLLSRSYLTCSAILPAGELVGPASSDYKGHLGNDREYGQLTVDYGGRIVDVYARQRALSG